ncbi:hypothetical protein N7532_009270 [Penicillium argentinense]|uniref:Uncharacterized protein n=1 Tax=Penicillium argentinense TaxID=1131581 RepID=A0A9W9K2T8_9EURO|nr:uncharacterized protein N7532_009270 [Penicillium argentinense]KAJ5090586.1 hypothetical protein N7532_009270 [Penicillium argentinense]
MPTMTSRVQLPALRTRVMEPTRIIVDAARSNEQTGMQAHGGPCQAQLGIRGSRRRPFTRSLGEGDCVGETMRSTPHDWGKSSAFAELGLSGPRVAAPALG